MSQSNPLLFFTWNTNIQFSNNKKIFNICRYFSEKKADCVLLQETGLLAPNVTIPKKFLCGFTLITNFCEKTLIRNHKTAVLISKRISHLIKNIDLHSSGRSIFLSIQLKSGILGICNLYLPQGTQKGKGAMFSKEGKKGMELIDHTINLSKNVDYMIFRGDFNESFSNERKPKRILPHPTFLSMLTGQEGFIDISRDHFPESDHTYFYKNKNIQGSRRLDRFLTSNFVASETISYQVHIGASLQSPQRQVSLTVNFKATEKSKNIKFHIPQKELFRAHFQIDKKKSNLVFQDFVKN